jgi:lambda repressor-like predicted transcriptional regulator
MTKKHRPAKPRQKRVHDHFYRIGGVALTLRQLASKFGVNPKTLWSRIHKLGKTPEEAVAYHRGPTAEVIEAAKRLNMSPKTIWDRLRSGWPQELALTLPAGTSPKKAITYKGETLSMTAWARRFNIEPDTLRKRLARGASFEEAVKMG